MKQTLKNLHEAINATSLEQTGDYSEKTFENENGIDHDHDATPATTHDGLPTRRTMMQTSARSVEIMVQPSATNDDDDMDSDHDTNDIDSSINTNQEIEHSTSSRWSHGITGATSLPQRFYIRGVHNTESNNYDSIESRQDRMIRFHRLIFFKEMIYQTIHYFAMPIMILFDGGLANAKAHGAVPYCTSFHPLLILSHVSWICWLLCNIMWIIVYNYKESWSFEMTLLNCNFFFRVVSIALRYGYMTGYELKMVKDTQDISGNINGNKNSNSDLKKNSQLRYTMLSFAWFRYNKNAIEYERENTELRLNWSQQSKQDKFINVYRTAVNSVNNSNSSSYERNRLYGNSKYNKGSRESNMNINITGNLVNKTRSTSIDVTSREGKIDIDAFIGYLLDEASYLQKGNFYRRVSLFGGTIVPVLHWCYLLISWFFDWRGSDFDNFGVDEFSNLFWC